MIKEFKKENLSIEVYRVIKTNIQNGLLAEGSKIPSENQLSKQLNVSRVVVREALQMLRHDHIIVTYQGKGSFVANPKNFVLKSSAKYPITAAQYEEIMEFRSCLEFAAIKKAVTIATDAELHKIYDIYMQMKNSVDDPKLFTLNDYKFHYAILEASHNSLILEAMNLKSDAIIECLEVMNQMNDSRAWAINLHQKIAEKLILRDAKSVIDLLKNNGEYNLARIQEFLNNVK